MTRRALRIASAGIAVILAALLLWIELSDDPLPGPPQRPQSSAVKQRPALALEDEDPSPMAPPTEAPEEPSDPPAAALIAVTVRDIADGTPVPALLFCINGREEPVLTDEQGVLRLGLRDFATLRPEGDEWKILRASGSEGPPEHETLWLHRYLRVLGTVRVESEVVELDPTRVSISVVAVGEEDDCDVVARERLDPSWYVRYSMYRITNAATVADDGSFEVTIPRIPGFTICASMPGWTPDQAPVAIHGDPCVVRLVLTRKSLRLTGIVRTADGKPLADVDVGVFVVVRLPADQVSREAFAAKGHAYKLRVSKERNQATVIYLLGGRTDANGVFKINSNVKGELSVIVRPGRGLQTTHVTEGLLSGDRDDLDVVVERGDTTRLQIVRSGMVLKHGRVLFGDHSLFELPAFSLTLDEAGRLPACM